MPNRRADMLDLLMSCPSDIAARIGYDKLTDMHNTWIQEMVFGDGDMTLQAHRGSFKTTCVCIALAFICILYPDQRTIFLRKTDDDVAEVMRATASILRSDYMRSITCELYGHDLELTKATFFQVSTNLALGVSGASQISGEGCGGSLTGKHADRIFTDDIINVRDRVSGAERERTKLVYQELQNIRNRGGRIINTGTPWHKDDAFLLMPNITKYDCYSTGLMTSEDIQNVRASMSPSLFAANYELKHIADEEALFTEPKFFSDHKLLFEGIGHIDASYGGADGTAFSVLMSHGDEYFCYIRLWQKHVDDCLNEILRICQQLKVGTIYCEQNADKGYLKKNIIKSGHPCAGYAESMNKYIKISTHLRQAWSRIRFLDSEEYPLDAEALNQILDYTEYASHDDMPDSLSCIIRQYERKPQMKLWKEGI